MKVMSDEMCVLLAFSIVYTYATNTSIYALLWAITTNVVVILQSNNQHIPNDQIK